MSTGPSKTGSSAKPGLGGFSTAPNNQAILLDKLNRRSTPDSEALASSDDEADQAHRQEAIQPPAPPHRPVRRASWLNDTSQPIARPRKGSFASTSMSPTASHPTTPSAEAGTSTWGTHSQSSVMNRGAAPPAFPWGTGIWSNERKDAQTRLSEVLPSPTSMVPPGSAGGGSFFNIETTFGQTSPGPRENSHNSQIPFAIPLHPTPKTYRSQSYSVGQMDPDSSAPSTMANPSMVSRNRGHPGLQHRPSRPSMLSEMASDGAVLGKVKEVEDDDDGESASESMQSSMHQSAEAKKIEMLTRENALLRQQQQQYQQNVRLRPRASTGAGYGLGNGYPSVPEESDYAIDELDETNDMEGASRRVLNRRMSEYGPGGARTHYENRKLENVKKAMWHSSLGFGPGSDGQQSRRHSFADLAPQRQASISSIGESIAQLETPTGDSQTSEYMMYQDGHNFSAGSPASYFTGGNLAASGQVPSFNNPFPSPYSMHSPYNHRVPSPHRNIYPMSQPRQNQQLHIVLFKCARADVFYIQEGTGLTVKPGDLVIVEADRGTDLGTVMRDNVEWQAAKDLKEHYAEEHYKWLMMYSQNAAAAQDGTGAGLMASSTGLQGSAVGGMGPPTQHHMQEPNSGELKPKLIKRLAQAHEIHALRDKEGNEAKAKRVCMQKVKEHGLNMEILDAEFQMDWKKLTFYYFADSYINFNSLVTDLFKIYKTRIWMSAINPASFASPTLGIQAPSGIGPGAVGVQRGANNSRQNQGHAGQQDHQQPQQQQQQQQAQPPPPPPQQQQPQQMAFPGSGAPGRAVPGMFGQATGGERSPVPSNYTQGGYPYANMSGLGNPPRAVNNMAYGPGGVPPLDSYSFSQGTDMNAIRGRFQTPPGGPGSHEGAIGSPTDWSNAFQGLSLNQAR